MLMTELVFMVKRAMGTRVKEVIYISDSMIALWWCSSLEKKLRLFVQNRVSTILRMVQWTLSLEDGDPLPLYHKEGDQNIAYLLTKEHPITAQDVTEGFLWQTGPHWLSKPVSQILLKKYDQIFMKTEEEKEALLECYSEPFMTSSEVDTDPSHSGVFSFKPVANLLTPRDGLLPFNLVRYGWVRGRNLVMSLLKFVDIWFHKSRLCKGTRNCSLCKAGEGRLNQTIALEKRVENLMFRLESAVIKEECPPTKISNFKYHNNILWSTGRFDSHSKCKCEDLEIELPFFDNSTIAPVVPVVREESQIFHSYALFVHLKIRPHSGVEITMKEIYKKMFVIGNARRVVYKV